MTYSGLSEQQTPAVAMAEKPEYTVVMSQIEAEKPSVEELAKQLITLGSFLNQLYTQAHLIHLNIEGPLFLPLHKFLKKQYQAHIDQFDSTAEFVRTLDFLLPMCNKGLAAANKNLKMVKSYECREMLMTYLANLDNCGMAAKEVLMCAQAVEAPDIENFLADLVGDMFKAAWQIKASLRSS
jgi:DNA-binding ferritin-like protein